MGSLDSLRKQIEQLVRASEQICAAARRSSEESPNIPVQFDNMQRRFLEAKDEIQEQIRQETLRQAEKKASVSGHPEVEEGARTGHKRRSKTET
jgi:vacuolar-type H+-ATPase subunit H